MDTELVVALPEQLREELKAPIGPVVTDTERLLAAVDGPLVAVGDVVTHHLREAGATPDVAVVDGMTEREAVGPVVEETVAALASRESGSLPVTVINPAATLTRDLLIELRAALLRDRPTLLQVEGEEDLVALPAIVAAPVGASVVYGQPGEGMVHVRVTEERKAEMHDLLRAMDGDYALLCDLLGVEPR